MALRRDDLLAPRVKEIKLKTLGESVHIRKLSAGDVVMADEGDVGHILSRSLCDAEGNLLFESNKEALGIPVQCVGEIMEHINAYNGLDLDEQEGN